MQCYSCGTEVRIEQGFCPKCGTFIGMPGAKPPQGNKSKLWLVLSGFLLFVVVLSVIPAWLLWKSGFLSGAKGPHPVFPGIPALKRQPHVPAKLSELHGHGTIYFIPLGDQAISPESLAAHYKKKFNLSITLLPALPLDRSAWNASRKQYGAERLLDSVKDAYPKLSAEENNVFIALTDADLYIESFDWRFTTSFREENHFGIVSSKRFDDAFWGDSPDPQKRQARMLQMLTKYIALLYYKLPANQDPGSILQQPLDPNGGPDDIWESDVHPEDSIYGLTGDQFCVVLLYSYQTGNLTLYPDGRDCNLPNVNDTSIEVFHISPKYADLSIKKTDFSLPGKPPITFQRVFFPRSTLNLAFGLAGNHSYDRYLYTDNIAVMDKVDLLYPDGSRWHFSRTSPGRGFVPGMTFVGAEDQREYSNAMLVRESDRLSLKLTDGESYWYLPCHGKTNCMNFESGYKDAEGNELKYTRRADQLQFLTAIANHDSFLSLTYDPKLRISKIHDQGGHRVLYEYDDTGYLSKVTYDNGTVTTYDHGNNGHLLKISVRTKHHPNATIFTAEFDDAHRLLKATLPGQGVYAFQYEFAGTEIKSALMTLPEGKTLRIEYDGDAYVAHSVK